MCQLDIQKWNQLELLITQTQIIIIPSLHIKYTIVETTKYEINW